MTCGGIAFLIALIVGGVWASDQVGAQWPLLVAIGIVILLIAWRILSIVVYRRQVNDLDFSFERAMAAKRQREAQQEVLFSRHEVISARQGAVFNWVRNSDGTKSWRLDYDSDPSLNESEGLVVRMTLQKLQAEVDGQGL